MTTHYQALLNGQRTDLTDFQDRGLAYGDGFFETMLLNRGVVPLWKYHKQRITRTLKHFAFSPLVEELEQQLNDFVAQLPNEHTAIIKLIVSRRSRARGYRVTKDTGINVRWGYFEAFFTPRETLQAGIKLSVSDYRLPRNPVLAGYKHLNRLDQVMASLKSADSSMSESLLLDNKGYVIEGLANNLFVLVDNEWVTPKLDFCGVQGVMRDYLLTHVQDILGVHVESKRIKLNHVLNAEEVFLCNSIYGVRPVSALGIKQYTVGALTEKLVDYIQTIGFGELYA